MAISEWQSVFEKSTNWQPTGILISRVPYGPGDPDGNFEWFPGPFGPIVWAPEHFFYQKVDFFPGSVVVFEKSANW